MFEMPQALAQLNDAELWRRCLEAQCALLPELSGALRRPVTDAALAALASGTALSLPSCLETGWRLHDGVAGEDSPASFLGLYWLSAEEALRCWQQWADVRGQGGASMQESLRSSARVVRAGTVQREYTHAGWLPLFRLAMEGDYIGIDFAPGPKGSVGQLINFGRDQDDKHVYAADLRSFLGWYLAELEAGRCHVEREDGASPWITHEDGWFFDLHGD